MPGEMQDAVRHMVMALNAEIESQRRQGNGSAPTAKLVAGRQEETTAGRRRYIFQKTTWPAEIAQDRALLIAAETRGPWYPVTECRPEGRQLRLTTEADLGASAKTAYLREDPGQLLASLRDGVAELSADRLSRARVVLGRGRSRSGDAPDAGALTGFREMNRAQQRAVSRALGSEVTFIWGPPGTGKTEVIGRVVEGCLRRGETVLFAAPTHVAVDQALERICALVADLPAFAEGLIRRVGQPQMAALIDRYGDFIDPDLALVRVAAPLDARIGELRRRQEELTGQLTAREAADDATQRLESQLADLERVERCRDELGARLSELDDELARIGAELEAALAQRFFGQRKAARLNLRMGPLVAERSAVHQNLTMADAGVTTRRRALPALRADAENARALGGDIDPARLRACVEQVLADVQGLTTERSSLEQRIAANCRLTAMTVARSCQGRVPHETPDVVVVDEAGMVNLPTAFHLASRAVKRLVFAGDFRQLPAIVTGVEDRRATEQSQVLVRDWLAKDAFRSSGVVSADGQVSADARLVRLDTQYRMRPRICAVVNVMAYPDAPLRTRQAEARQRGPLARLPDSG